MSVTDKLHSGELYFPGDTELLKKQLKCLDKVHKFNRIRPSNIRKKTRLLKGMFAAFGEGSYIETPFYSNFGGAHVHFGKNVYANYGLTLVDDTYIYVGDYTMFGPNVVVATAGHPILPELRKEGLQYNAPVTIGENCWIGAGVIIVPGVTIGDNVVIGAGSIVTKNIPSNTVAVGNPCKVLREVGERDKIYYFKDKKIKY